MRFGRWSPVVNNRACVIAVKKIKLLKESLVPNYLTTKDALAYSEHVNDNTKIRKEHAHTETILKL